MIMPMITYHALKGTERILEGGNVMRLTWLPVRLEGRHVVCVARLLLQLVCRRFPYENVM